LVAWGTQEDQGAQTDVEVKTLLHAADPQSGIEMQIRATQGTPLGDAWIGRGELGGELEVVLKLGMELHKGLSNYQEL
jgi:hypothetical protein